MHHIHQGDDVWLSNKSRHFAALLFYQMNAFGFRFTPSKQMFGRGFGEFLRVMYNPAGGNGYGVRSMVNYHLKPIQNARILNIQAYAASLCDTYYVLQRRGFNISFLNTMWECDLLHWTCLKRDNTDKQPLRLPSWIIQLNSCEGGFGCPRPGTFVTSRLTLVD